MTGDSGRVLVLAFAANAILAGGNSVAIRFSNRELAPLWGATLRFALAAALLLAVTAALRLTMPRGKALQGALLYGVSNSAALLVSITTHSFTFTRGWARRCLRSYLSPRFCSPSPRVRSVSALWRSSELCLVSRGSG